MDIGLQIGKQQVTSNSSLMTKNLLKVIIKNEKNEVLIFKYLDDKWDVFTTNMLKGRDMKETIYNKLKDIFPELNISMNDLIFSEIKNEDNELRINIFKLNQKINKTSNIQIKNQRYITEYKWYNDKKIKKESNK